ncbi:DUF1799 domain-containing protein [Pseudomonas sp.]|uniref:DUF1799 domain-containing protein n=1 Tax=Pseudomonas sp. TaxID=306 RepID=UPI003CC6AC37
MEAFGFEPGDYEDSVEVLADVWGSFTVFDAMSTQWRTGACGATGLDYGALPAVMRLMAVPAADRRSIFHDLRLMEAEALGCMAQGKG